MKKINVLIAAILMIASYSLTAQVAVTTDGSSADGSAMLEVKSTTKGMLIPRMTESEITVITSPANGLIVFNTTDNKFYTYILTDNEWKEIAYGTGTIAGPFTCGGTLSINHTSGYVAPETKTVNYGTVVTDLTGTDKCWITQNLGADQQATSASDATDASAGWYWQFNRKQGYGAPYPTPAWTITSISENTDWVAAQDPCTIELGAGWRIPTYTEWLNADATGGWNNYNDTYASVLKLHAAGYLDKPDGSLMLRGGIGLYWSSSDKTADQGWFLWLNEIACNVTYQIKANGFAVRCLMD